MSSAATDVAVELSDVRHGYDEGGERHEILRGVDLAVHRGELVAILGRSGSGKSTLLHLIGALDRPWSGRILHQGVDVVSSRESERTLLRRRRLGFVFQAFHLVPVLTVEENVALPLELDGRLRAEDRERVRELLDRVGLADRARAFPDRLSGGEQQRVALARALVRRPELVLADEPTGNLDEDSAETVLALLIELCRDERAAVVMATHSHGAASRCDRVVRLDHGRLADAIVEPTSR